MRFRIKGVRISEGPLHQYNCQSYLEVLCEGRVHTPRCYNQREQGPVRKLCHHSIRTLGKGPCLIASLREGLRGGRGGA